MDTNDQRPTVAVMDVVVCAGSQEVTLTSTVDFRDKVERVLDIRASIGNIVYHIMGAGLIVQGILLKQIFYLGNQGNTKLETEQIPFATFIKMEGILSCHTIRIAGRVSQMQRQVYRQGESLKQKTTLVLEASALESRRYVIYGSDGYLYRVREIIFRKECRQREHITTVSRLTVRKIRATDLRLKNMVAHPGLDKVTVRGTITRKIDYEAATRNLNLEEEHPFEYTFDIPGVKPDMCIVIQGEDSGKIIQGAIPTVTEGTTIDQDITLAFSMYVCRYKRLSLVHDEGPVMLLQKPVGTGGITRKIEHEIDLQTDAASVLRIESRLSGLEWKLISHQMLIWGYINYNLTYVSTTGQEMETGTVQPFVTALGFAGTAADNYSEVKLVGMQTQATALDQRKIRLCCQMQLDAQTFEELLMPVAAQQLLSV